MYPSAARKRYGPGNRLAGPSAPYGVRTNRIGNGGVPLTAPRRVTMMVFSFTPSRIGTISVRCAHVLSGGGGAGAASDGAQRLNVMTSLWLTARPPCASHRDRR